MITYQNLTKEDIKQVVLLEEDLLNETLGAEMLENELENHSVCFLTAKDGLKVIGYIGCYVYLNEGEVLNFVVDEAYQRQGIGTKLLNLVTTKFNLTKITLEVRENNQKGLNFYLKNDFKKVNIRKHYYKNGDNAVVMMKEIL